MVNRTLLSSCTSAFQCGLKRRMNFASAQPRILQPYRINILGKDITDPNLSSNINSSKSSTRNIHTSPTVFLAKSEKELLKRSPFSRFERINVSEKYSIRRELKEGDNTYGVRRYLLLPRKDADVFENEQSTANVIASLNANRNVIFGAQLHAHSTTDNDDNYDDYVHEYLAACGYLLDIAREDASINGQQTQALAVLNGLCSWVEECLDKDGEGSEVLMGLMHGQQQSNNTAQEKKEKSKLPLGRRAGQNIQNASAEFFVKKKSDRIEVLGAIRAIATGVPRPGHSVVGAGTYRDGKNGWMALAREYSQLTAANPDAVSLDASYVGRRGLEEMALYKSREGEVTKIEHLAHTQPEYLREAGGAMARLFFV